MNDICRVVRLSDAGLVRRIAYRTVMRLVKSIKRSGQNVLVESYRSDQASAACAALYSIGGPGTHDIFRDLIVLKRASSDEKGVILLKYARTFDAVVSLFDVSRLMDRYLFVLEPCWAGYCDPSILMFIAPGHPVFVQCFTEQDYRFIEDVGSPLVPVRLGPADWVDTDLFAPVEAGTKPYDLVMVANWAPHKRHAQLFHALNQIKNRKIRVLLVGFPWGGRTTDDIRREAKVVRNDLVQIDILERIPQRELAGYLNQCKVFVFLSRKEGDNKALVEAMFANVPAIVFEQTIGGARSRVNPSTGVLASDRELPKMILYMLDHYLEFSPRAWAIRHTGSAIASRILNDAIERSVTESGGKFVGSLAEKTNSPNLSYKSDSHATFEADYGFILSCRRKR